MIFARGCTVIIMFGKCLFHTGMGAGYPGFDSQADVNRRTKKIIKTIKSELNCHTLFQEKVKKKLCMLSIHIKMSFQYSSVG